MSKKNPGGLISTTGLRKPSATDQSQNSGVWDLDEQYQARANSTWANPSGQAYEIGNSLRFRASASAYLNRTPSVAGNRKTWTWSGWVKPSNNEVYLFQARVGVGSYPQIVLRWSDDKLRLLQQDGGNQILLDTNAVFRDHSAWYHVVCAVDTTQATSSSRAFLYVNGVLQSLSTATYPTQNLDTPFNSTIQHLIGSQFPNAGSQNFFDGYMAEINFVDGQALDPTYFGYTDFNGVWQPKKYIGAYGVNGFYLPFSENNSVNNLTRNFGNGSNYRPYSQTFSDASWQKNNVTIGAAVTAPDGSNTAITLIDNSTFGNHTVYGSSAVTTVAGATYTLSAFAKAGTHTIFGIWETNATGTWATYNLVTGTVTGTTGISATIENVGNGWYRCILTLAAGGGSTGIGLSTAQSNVYPGNNYVGTGTNLFIWGAQINLGNSVDQYTPTVASAVNNDWTPNNISVAAGVTYDSMVDSPTNSSSTADTGLGGQVGGNYCTFNPLSASINYFNGNLRTTWGSNDLGSISTLSVSSGKWYWEYTATSNTNGECFGVVSSIVDKRPNKQDKSKDPGFWGAQNINVFRENGNIVSGTPPNPGAGGIVQIALDVDNRKYWYGVNGTWYNSGNPSTGDNATSSNLTANETWHAFIEHRNSAGDVTVNFGQRPFAYAAPAGFKCLNTANLPQPTIPDGREYFNTVLYTGTGSARSVMGVGFQPDFVWVKGRSQAYSNSLADVLRGPTLRLKTNSTDVEAADMGLTSFDSDGFTFNGSNNNNSGETFVAWNWRANGAGVSNTAGSITSTVSAGVTQGFSIVTYTGNGSAGATVGHGLGVAPSVIFPKVRSRNGDNWHCYHRALGGTQGILLNATNAASTDSGFWNNTNPSNSVITLGTYNTFSSQTYVAYCFAEVEGYSKFSSYIGNGSTDGPFIYTGFRPRFVMVKCTSSAGFRWIIWDTARDPINFATRGLSPNLSVAEITGFDADILSNGFKLRDSEDTLNGSGATYIYMAFAEHPFKTSRAR